MCKLFKCLSHAIFFYFVFVSVGLNIYAAGVAYLYWTKKKNQKQNAIETHLWCPWWWSVRNTILFAGSMTLELNTHRYYNGKTRTVCYVCIFRIKPTNECVSHLDFILFFPFSSSSLLLFRCCGQTENTQHQRRIMCELIFLSSVYCQHIFLSLSLAFVYLCVCFLSFISNKMSTMFIINVYIVCIFQCMFVYLFNTVHAYITYHQEFVFYFWISIGKFVKDTKQKKNKFKYWCNHWFAQINTLIVHAHLHFVDDIPCRAEFVDLDSIFFLFNFFSPFTRQFAYSCWFVVESTKVTHIKRKTFHMFWITSNIFQTLNVKNVVRISLKIGGIFVLFNISKMHVFSWLWYLQKSFVSVDSVFVSLVYAKYFWCAWKKKKNKILVKKKGKIKDSTVFVVLLVHLNSEQQQQQPKKSEPKSTRICQTNCWADKNTVCTMYNMYAVKAHIAAGNHISWDLRYNGSVPFLNSQKAQP